VSLGGSVTTTGAMTFNDAVTAGAITLNAGAGVITATNAANDFTGTVTASGSSVSLRDANALAAMITAAGAGSLQAGTTLAASGSTGTTLTTSSGGATSFGATTVGTDLVTTSGGAVSQTGPLVVNGTTTINAGANPITLTNGGNNFVGAVNLTGGTTQITDANALTLGTVSTGSLTTINTGALNLGTGMVSGALFSTSNGGAVSQSGPLTVTGTTNVQAGAGSITLANASNDFGGAVTAGGTVISFTDVNTLTPSTINAGSGSVTLIAGTIGAGGTVTGASATLNSASNVTGLNVDFQGTSLLLTGNASSWTLTGPPTQPLFSVTNAATNIFYNGAPISGAVVVAQQQSGVVIGSTLADIARAALLEAQDTDSVSKQMNYGFAGDVGTTPPMDHRIDETGISVPGCFNDSRDGQACQ